MLVAVLWSFTLFDTLGASIGASKAVWVLFVMCASPVFWYDGWYFVYSRWKPYAGRNDVSLLKPIVDLDLNSKL
jgi:hypothetical protein